MGPSSILWEEFFFIQIPFKEEMRQMEKNNKNNMKIVFLVESLEIETRSRE